jgi:hypothetical protein
MLWYGYAWQPIYSLTTTTGLKYEHTTGGFEQFKLWHELLFRNNRISFQLLKSPIKYVMQPSSKASFLEMISAAAPPPQKK